MAPNNKMWHKRYLIPLWLVQLIVLGIYFILACVGMSAVEDIDDYYDNYSSYSSYDTDQIITIYRTVFGIIIAFASLCLLLIFVEIGLAATHKLKPTFHLVSAVIKALISVIYFIVVIIGSASVGRGYALDIILSLAITLSTVGQVIYGSVLVHRVRKGIYNSVRGGSGSEGHGPVTYKGQGQQDVELQAGQGAVYR